jgi:site-specific recombinase XerD
MAFIHKIQRKKGIAWRVCYRLHGKQKAEFLPIGTTPSQAKNILAEFQKRLISSHIEGKPFFSPLQFGGSPVSLSEFREWFFENKKLAVRRGRSIDDRTLETYDYAFKKLVEVMGNQAYLSDLPHRLKEIEGALGSYSPNSQSIIVRSLRSAWNFGIQRGVIERNPFLIIPITQEKKDIGFWTIAEKDRIFEKIQNPEAKRGFLLGRYAGLRKIEICRNVRWEDLHWDSGYGVIPQAKTGENQNFIIFPALQAHLAPLAGTGYICLLHPASLSHEITRARIAAGVQKPGSIRMLRHSLAHELLSQGYDIRFVQIVLRHSTIVTTQIYTNFRTDEIKNILRDARL